MRDLKGVVGGPRFIIFSVINHQERKQKICSIGFFCAYIAATSFKELCDRHSTNPFNMRCECVGFVLTCGGSIHDNVKRFIRFSLKCGPGGDDTIRDKRHYTKGCNEVTPLDAVLRGQTVDRCIPGQIRWQIMFLHPSRLVGV